MPTGIRARALDFGIGIDLHPTRHDHGNTGTIAKNFRPKIKSMENTKNDKMQVWRLTGETSSQNANSRKRANIDSNAKKLNQNIREQRDQNPCQRGRHTFSRTGVDTELDIVN